MRALLVIVIIIAVIALIMFIPVKCTAYLSYTNNELDEALDVRYGFIRLKLPKFRKKASQAAEDAAETVDREAETRPRKVKRMISFVRGNLKDIKEAMYSILGYLFRRAVKINRLTIKMVFGTSDAMETGLLYGAVAAFVYNVAGVIDRKMRLGKHDINLKPDFNHPHIFAELEAIITTNLLNLTVLGVIILRRGLPLLDRYRNSKSGKGEKNNGESD